MHAYVITNVINSMELVDMFKPRYIVVSKFTEFWAMFREPPPSQATLLLLQMRPGNREAV